MVFVINPREIKKNLKNKKIVKYDENTPKKANPKRKEVSLINSASKCNQKK